MSEFPYYSGITNTQNRYQPVLNSNLSQQPHHHNPFVHTTDYPVQQKSDKDYFESLKHYRPLGYSGEGTPLLLINDHWWGSLGCIIFFDILFCVCVGLFIFLSNNTSLSSKPNDSIFPAANQRSSSDTFLIGLSSAICLVFINVSYFFCQFMNPGVINVTNIKDEQFHQNGKKFCEHCYCYRTEDMHHCKECHVCVWGLDHHCGFFNKCIAGWQKWAFYTFLTSLFCGFLLIMVCMGMTLVFF